MKQRAQRLFLSCLGGCSSLIYDLKGINTDSDAASVPTMDHVRMTRPLALGFGCERRTLRCDKQAASDVATMMAVPSGAHLEALSTYSACERRGLGGLSRLPPYAWALALPVERGPERGHDGGLMTVAARTALRQKKPYDVFERVVFVSAPHRIRGVSSMWTPRRRSAPTLSLEAKR